MGRTTSEVALLIKVVRGVGVGLTASNVVLLTTVKRWGGRWD